MRLPAQAPSRVSETVRDGAPRILGNHRPVHRLQKEVIETRVRMGTELSELKTRLSPGYVAHSLWAGLKHHPLRAFAVSAASTGLGGYLYWRKQQRIAMIKNHGLKRPFFLRLRR